MSNVHRQLKTAPEHFMALLQTPDTATQAVDEHCLILWLQTPALHWTENTVSIFILVITAVRKMLPQE